MANQYKNKIIYGNQTLMDITDTTATEQDVLEGEVFYNASGARSVGTLSDATTTTHGLMSASDKIKLDGIDLLGVKLNTTTLTPDANGFVFIPLMTGATSSADGTAGLIPAPTSADREKFFCGDGTWQDGGRPMVILSYGSSTWQDFINAYNNNVIVYCRASSNSNPASGSQTRMAFMAYVSDATNPTNVEFQYYRSMSSHSATAMGDEVYVYKLTNADGGTWSVTTRKASIKEIAVASGSKLGVSWSSDKVTLSNTMTADDMPMSSSDATIAGTNITANTTAISNLSQDMAPIITGKQCPVTVSANQYVLLRGSTITGCSDGAYTATKAIPANTDLDNTYLTALTAGVSNGLKSEISALNSKIDDLPQLIGSSNSSILNLVYPIGAVYISVVNTSPATLFGGTWVQLKDRFLLGAGDTYTNGATGGAASVSYTPAGTNSGGSVQNHTLTTAQIPSHSHGLNSHTHTYDKAKTPTGGPSTTNAGDCALTTAQLASHKHSMGAFTAGSKPSGEFNADWTRAGSKDTDSAGSGNNHTHSLNSHTHTNSYTSTNSGPASGNTVAAGSGNAHNHGFTDPTFTGTAATIATMPPYLAVYMWKRTA